MRKPSVASEEIIEAGEFLLKEKVTVNGYTLKKQIGKGRPERLFEIWQNHLAENSTNSNSETTGLAVADIHVLDPEVESLLGNLIEDMEIKLKDIVLGCDNKAQLMADKKISVVKKDYELDLDKLYTVLDSREEYIGELQIKNEKLKASLEKLKLIEANQFEYQKTFIKLRGRLQSRNELLNERQLRIAELVKLNHVLEDKTNT